MTMSTMDKNQIIGSTVDGFRVRAHSHYVTLSTGELNELAECLEGILTPHSSDINVQNRQYNPKTDTVEEI
jgi:hypothetical protein